VTLVELRAALLDTPGRIWLDDAVTAVCAGRGPVAHYFAAAGRRCGRAALPGAPGWTADVAARALLLDAVLTAPVGGQSQVGELYRRGSTDEKIAILRALPMLPIDGGAVALLHDALRSNDARLVAAALGPYARHLDPATWRQAVLKCVFMGIGLSFVDGLADLSVPDERADAELARMLAALVEERTAAGRTVPSDAVTLLARLRGFANGPRSPRKVV
jgi:hypothetical protein